MYLPCDPSIGLRKGDPARRPRLQIVEPLACLPAPGSDGFTRKNYLAEPGLELFESTNVVAARSLENRSCGKSEGAETVEDGLREAGAGGEGGIYVKGIHIPHEPVDKGLIRRSLIDDLKVRRTMRRDIVALRLRSRVSPPAAFASTEKAGETPEEHFTLFGRGLRSHLEQGGLALIVDAVDSSSGEKPSLRRYRSVGKDGLLAVEHLLQVYVEVRNHLPEHPEGRDHPEGGNYPQASLDSLENILELLRRSADTQVIENHLPPGILVETRTERLADQLVFDHATLLLIIPW
jgi:hypothetical protein